MLDPVDTRPKLSPIGEGLLRRSRTDIRKAAVLLPFIDRPNAPTLLLTVRPKTMVDHAGQIAFPGGKIDRSDLNSLSAALREAHEEIALNPADIHVFAQSAEYKTRSGFDIMPFLAAVPASFEPKAEAGEVDDIFEVPLSYVLNLDNYTVQDRSSIEGLNIKTLSLKWNAYNIWGVTAGIIYYISQKIVDNTAHKTNRI